MPKISAAKKAEIEKVKKQLLEAKPKRTRSKNTGLGVKKVREGTVAWVEHPVYGWIFWDGSFFWGTKIMYGDVHHVFVRELDGIEKVKPKEKE